MKNKTEKGPFEKMSSAVANASGSTAAFITAFAIIIVWALCGHFFDYSNTWQLMINTTTTITTFLMVFLIHRSQHNDSMALHLKLNELIVAHGFASNRLVAIEDISEDELKILKKYYKHIALLTKNIASIKETHSESVANSNHKRTKSIRKGELTSEIKTFQKKLKQKKASTN